MAVACWGCVGRCCTLMLYCGLHIGSRPGTVIIRRPYAYQGEAGAGADEPFGSSVGLGGGRGCVVLASRCSVPGTSRSAVTVR